MDGLQSHLILNLFSELRNDLETKRVTQCQRQQKLLQFFNSRFLVPVNCSFFGYFTACTEVQSETADKWQEQGE